MKKISILLISVLFALVLSCSNKSTSPGNNDGNSTQNGIPLSQRAGTYSGDMNGMKLVIVLNDQAQVTSITVNGSESIDSNNPIIIEEGATYTGTTIKPFVAYVKMGNNSFPAVVKIYFKSADDASQGATAKVQIGATDPSQFDENNAATPTVELTYAAPAAN
ncbi:hypothetical protein [Brachyspira sp. G79]|uniref:hypothetical protein n=1 Tax=Brachyspira sp. G79 TaxID=1358104 RepID=UPI000BBBF8D1|nr:hypothetical protein [Brachyspira sp. G79]PCG20398.1 hypothetical protein KQ44_10570 [Brachyspira sp. G79]